MCKTAFEMLVNVLNVSFSEFFTFAVLTVSWRLKRINLIGIYRIDLSYLFFIYRSIFLFYGLHFVWCVMLCFILDLCEIKRRFASDSLHTNYIFFTISSHSHIIFRSLFFSWNWLVRICTHAFHRFTGLFFANIYVLGRLGNRIQ